MKKSRFSVEQVVPEPRLAVLAPVVTTRRDVFGMGLSISRSIVEADGGRLGVEPNADRGSTVRVTLPAVDGAGADG